MTHARYLVISSSLHSDSRSRLLARAAYRRMLELTESHSIVAASVGSSGGPGAESAEVGWIDLAEMPLPLCDGQAAYGDPRVGRLSEQISHARGILLAAPIYNYDVNAALKNLVELTGRAWQDKVVGMMCAAGGAGSYMSLMPLANSLMLDFRCLILPRFVYATGDAFAAEDIEDETVKRRLNELTERLYQVANAVPLPPKTS